MRNTVACFKWVLDDTDIIVRNDLQVDYSRAGGKISEYDRNALQAAAEGAAALGGKGFGLTFGDNNVKSALRDALSRGIDEVYYIADDIRSTADNAVTAKILAASIQVIPDVALVFCAEGASDTFARQTGPRLAATLRWPVITSVSSFEVKEDRVIAVRKLDDVQETLEVGYPVVLSITSEAAGAPIPGMRAVMASAKKPQNRINLAELGLPESDLRKKTETVSSHGYKMIRKNTIFNEGGNRDIVDALLSALNKEGVL